MEAEEVMLRRQAIDGTLHGRNASVLPECVIERARR